MKKLILALILAVVLTVTLATPAFAGPPEDKPGNMPGKAADFESPWLGLSGAIRHIAWGWHWGSGNGAHTNSGWGIGVSVRHAIFNIMGGDPPGQPWWWSAP